MRLALDVGTVRIGVAKCDPDGLMAVPLETVDFGDQAIARIAELVSELDAIAVYVGNPISLKGKDTQSTLSALNFASELAKSISGKGGSSEVSVRMIDERLSTVSAQRGLHEAGRSIKTSRVVIDQAAAVVILEHALESEKRQGALVGKEVVAGAES